MKQPTRQPVSARIRARLLATNSPFTANDSIAIAIKPGELAQLERELTDKMKDVLNTLVIDTVNDANTQRTAERVARMYLRELFRGRYEPPPVATDFPNTKKLDEMYVVGPITIRSACSHHLCPVEGSAWCGVIPGGRVLGLSKFARLADWVMSRPQIQEEAVIQLADLLEDQLKPRGLAVILRARHACMTWRGVREHDTVMTTSVMRGIFRDGPAARTELLAMIGNSQGASQCR